MSDLLNESDFAEINAAFGDLKDTFHKNTVVYNKVTSGYSLMDNGTNTTTTTVNLDCRVTVKDDSGSEDAKTTEGSKNEHDIEIRFFAAYLKSKSLMTGNDPEFEVDKTTFNYSGEKYQLKLISFDDSDLGGNVVLVVCHCSRMIDGV